MYSRRRFLQVCAAGTAGVLAGCEGVLSEETPDRTPGQARSDTATSEDDVLYENGWEGVTIDKGDGWITALPELRESADLFYSVRASEPVRFDVYVFAEQYTKRQYEEWIVASPGEREETRGITGLSGATKRNQLEAVEHDAFVDAGTMWIAVDHSDFHGGYPRAEVDEESPEQITVDVTVRATAAF